MRNMYAATWADDGSLFTSGVWFKTRRGARRYGKRNFGKHFVGVTLVQGDFEKPF